MNVNDGTTIMPSSSSSSSLTSGIHVPTPQESINYKLKNVFENREPLQKKRKVIHNDNKTSKKQGNEDTNNICRAPLQPLMDERGQGGGETKGSWNNTATNGEQGDWTDSLLNVNSDYYFMYDSTNVNPNNIHLLRAQMFLELENYDAAQEEISQVELSSTDVTFNLDSLYQGPGSNYDMYLYIGFRGQDKHLFKLEEYSITRTFTPLLPCLDLIVDELEISDNEVVECLDYMPSNILEYKFSIQIPSIINEASNATDCDFDWDNDQCVEEWIINMENLDEDSTCIEDGFRTLEILGNEGGLTVPGVCYGSCDACSDE